MPLSPPEPLPEPQAESPVVSTVVAPAPSTQRLLNVRLPGLPPSDCPDCSLCDSLAALTLAHPSRMFRMALRMFRERRAPGGVRQGVAQGYDPAHETPEARGNPDKTAGDAVHADGDVGRDRP
ncbi:hypothetical protein GCM10010344_25210 [Streptomyces bluensis]|nr:hypothetical protein GCM10010344_25210 [Streptomyces bluensis]